MNTHSLPLRVLVIDDEPLICWSVAETLCECGDVLTEARTGTAATRILSERREPIDVVLLDYQLPDVRDLSLLANIRRLSPESRIILMTAYHTPEIVEEALALGASRVIAKPIDMRDLQTIVHDVASPVVH